MTSNGHPNERAPTKERGHGQDLSGLLGQAGPTPNQLPHCGVDLTAGGTDQSTEAGAACEAVRTTAAAAHLSSFAGLVVPLGSVIGPLTVWLTRHQRHRFIDQAGREARNLGITIASYGSGAGGRRPAAGRDPPADGRGGRLGGAGPAGRHQGQPGPGLPVPADHPAGPLTGQAQRARPTDATTTLGLPRLPNTPPRHIRAAPRLLLGDLNLPSTVLRRGWPETGRGRTFPNSAPTSSSPSAADDPLGETDPAVAVFLSAMMVGEEGCAWTDGDRSDSG